MSINLFLKAYFWWPIKHRIFHPRAAMRDQVFPPHHRSLEDTIIQFHLAAIIELVNKNDYFDDYRQMVTKTPEFTSELRECYEYALMGRTLLQRKIGQAWDKVFKDNSPENFAVVMELEQELYDYDTEVCNWVIKNRSKFFS